MKRRVGVVVPTHMEGVVSFPPEPITTECPSPLTRPAPKGLTAAFKSDQPLVFAPAKIPLGASWYSFVSPYFANTCEDGAELSVHAPATAGARQPSSIAPAARHTSLRSRGTRIGKGIHRPPVCTHVWLGGRAVFPEDPWLCVPASRRVCLFDLVVLRRCRA